MLHPELPPRGRRGQGRKISSFIAGSSGAPRGGGYGESKRGSTRVPVRAPIRIPVRILERFVEGLSRRGLWWLKGVLEGILEGVL